MLRFLAYFCVFVSFIQYSSFAGWTQFRGPNGQGISDDKTIPTKFSSENLVWKIEPKGKGHGSPVVQGDRVYLISSDPKDGKHFLECFDISSGKQTWVKTYESSLYRMHRYNHQGSTTPALSKEQIFILYGSPEAIYAASLDLNGKEIWKQNLGPFQSRHGYGTSPLYHEGLVYINHNHLGKSSLIALNAKTGKTVWQKSTESGRAAYGTPCIYNNTLVFSSSGSGIMALNKKDGKQLWQVNGIFDKRNLTGPVIAGDTLLATNGSGGGGNSLVAVKASTEDNQAKLVYKNKKNIAYVPKCIYKDGMIFVLSDRGVASCLEAKAGERLWKEDLRGNFFSSLICVDNKLYAISHSGDITVFKASKNFELVSRSKLEDRCFSTPAVSNGKILIHTFNYLACYSNKK